MTTKTNTAITIVKLQELLAFAKHSDGQFALVGVRTACPRRVADRRCERIHVTEPTGRCLVCQDRGEVPVTNGWVWWQATAEFIYENDGIWDRFILSWQSYWAGGNDSETAFFLALQSYMGTIPGIVYPVGV